MDYTIAHDSEMNNIGLHLWPDGHVPYDEALAPDVESGDERRFTGRLRGCAYCGSMHPADVAAAIRSGARGSWADWKYGWPHKAYFYGVPNPHAGMIEVRAQANHQYAPDWIQFGEWRWRAPGKPASATTMGKFYSVHLLDATPDERNLIEAHLGIHFVFLENGQVRWERLR